MQLCMKHETPTFLMFGRQARFPVGIILSIPHAGKTVDTEVFAQNSRGNLQIAFELARPNLTERATKQAVMNELASFPLLKPGPKVLVYRPFHDTDGLNPKLLLLGENHMLYALNSFR